MHKKIKVGVLRGGPSDEHDISFKTGANVLKNLPEHYFPIDIFIDKGGKWHVHGIEEAPAKIFKKVDVLFNALHGEYGEDGKIQRMLDMFNVPYTGSGQLASAFAMHKGHAKKLLKTVGIKSPHHKIVKKDHVSKDMIRELFQTSPHPSVIKPVGSGSSLGVSVVLKFSEFEQALEKAFSVSPTVMIEEYIKGKEATCGVLESFRGENVYSLLPVEISLPESSVFFDFDAKYGGKSKVVAPGRFSASEKHEIQEMAKKIHKALGLRHYSRSDFVISPTRGVCFLEVNSLPTLTSESAHVRALESVGLSLSGFLDHVIKLALSKK